MREIDFPRRPDVNIEVGDIGLIEDQTEIFGLCNKSMLAISRADF